MEQPEAMTEGTVSAPVHRRRSVRTARWLAWSLWALSMMLVVLGILLALSNRVNGSITSPYLVNLIVPAVAFSTVGALVASRRSENPIGWLFGVSGLLYAVLVFAVEYYTYTLVTGHGSLPGGLVAAWLGSWLYILSGNLVLYSFLLFPNGRLPSSRWRVVAWLVALIIFLSVVPYALMPGPLDGYPEVENPFGIERAAGLLGLMDAVADMLMPVALLAPVAALVVRYRRSRREERQQIKWVAYAITILPVAIIAVSVWPTLEESTLGIALFLIGSLAISTAVGVAILKHRLYDIDLVINRTLVYGALTACVVGIYVFIVGYLATLFRAEDNLLISLVATGVVAVLFAPLRDRLQRGLNRLMYGERDDPYAVLSRLGQRLEATVTPDAVLPAVVQTVKEALKLPYAAISLDNNGAPKEIAAGEPVEKPLRLPLAYRNEPVGELLLGPRPGEEGFSSADRRLLEDLARQAGVAAHAVRLTNDLQHSREWLVTAREEERRRLRRDLHDGLGAQLAGLNVQAGALRRLIPSDPTAADELVVELRDELRSAIADIRRLAYDLRPPALDDLGLVGALDRLAERYGAQSEGLQVLVEAPEDIPALPAAIEVAVYRVAQEALTNVVRHARARTCVVRLVVTDEVRVEIEDDGAGMPPTRGAGVGLISMRERAAELGGACTVEPVSRGGTRVLVQIPLPEKEG